MAVQFSPAARAKFDDILTRYPIKRAAIMPTLWLAQEEFGWLSHDVLEYVAGLLGLSPKHGVDLLLRRRAGADVHG